MRERDPERYGQMKKMHYTQGSGPPVSAEVLAEEIMRANETAELRSTDAILPTFQEAVEYVRPYVDQEDWLVKVATNLGPKGGFHASATHKSFADL
jgi:hypothetical protein